MAGRRATDGRHTTDHVPVGEGVFKKYLQRERLRVRPENPTEYEIVKLRLQFPYQALPPNLQEYYDAHPERVRALSYLVHNVRGFRKRASRAPY